MNNETREQALKYVRCDIPSNEQMVAWARQVLIDKHAEDGDSFCTPEELKNLYSDPFAEQELIRDEMIANHGWIMERSGFSAAPKQVAWKLDYCSILQNRHGDFDVVDIVDTIMPVRSFSTFETAALYAMVVAAHATDCGY